MAQWRTAPCGTGWVPCGRTGTRSRSARPLGLNALAVLRLSRGAQVLADHVSGVLYVMVPPTGHLAAGVPVYGCSPRVSKSLSPGGRTGSGRALGQSAP
ncbi:hypothetical protein ACFQ60_47710 [Streptomyces zhihengii]